MTLDELNRYYNNLMDHLNGDQLFSISNLDRAHNTTIIKLMLDNCQNINMFCGEMSVFRSKFYDHINNENKSSGDKDLGDTLRKQLEDSLKRFVEQSDHKLRIIVANHEKLQFSDLLIKQAFMLGVSRGIIEMYRLDKRYIFAEPLRHCTYSEDRRIVRMEEDQESHAGICSLCIDQKLLDMLKFNFETMLRASESLESLLN